MSSIDFSSVERGNTSPGVNRSIIKYLLAAGGDFAGERFFDIPCGAGSFLDAVKKYFPQAHTIGGDIVPPPANFPHEFLIVNAQSGDPLTVTEKCRVITCISGVMEFDNTLAFFRQLRHHLDDDGCLIVTNDNLLSVRDRLLYLFFGRFRQYKLLIPPPRPTWKILTLQNLLRIVTEAEFETTEVIYVAPKKAELIWLPLALPLYLIQSLYLHLAESEATLIAKNEFYPFRSLLARHYILVCRLPR